MLEKYLLLGLPQSQPGQGTRHFYVPDYGFYDYGLIIAIFIKNLIFAACYEVACAVQLCAESLNLPCLFVLDKG